MAATRKSIRLNPEEDNLLRQRYLAEAIPSDQYSRRPADLARFISRWNALSEREDSAEDILHYIKTRRKRGLWVTFDGAHKSLPTLTEDILSPEEWAHLKSIYDDLFVSVAIGSDNLAYDRDLAKAVSKEFTRLAGRALSGHLLLAIIMVKRKRGDWVKLAPDAASNKGVRFGDIDQIAS